MQLSTLPYRPGGLPLRWADDQSGQLRDAILSYLDLSMGASAPLPKAKLDLVIGWCRYYINAPCWMALAQESGDDENIAGMRLLIDKVANLRTPEDITDWIHDCLSVGIDPL